MSNFSLAGSSTKPSATGKKLSVLDQLDAYWQEHDAISAATSQVQFGIMNKQAQDMMLLSNSGKKRSGAFCVGI